MSRSYEWGRNKKEEVGRKNYIQLDTFSVDDHVSIYAIF